MSGENTNPAIDVAAIIKSATEAAVKAVKDEYAPQLARLDELEKNLDTVANTIKNAPPIDKDGLQNAVNDVVRSALEAERTAAADAQAKATARTALIEKITTEKLGGKKELADLLTGDDEAALLASADKVAATAKTLNPDFGSSTTDGGNTPANGGGEKKLNPNVPENIAKYASTIVLPK
jgi:hypothetical protein